MGYGKLGPAVRWPTEVLRMTDLNLFFSDLSEPFREIFADCERVWEPLKTLGPRLEQLIRKKAQSESHTSHLPGIRTTLDHPITTEANKDFTFRTGSVWLNRFFCKNWISSLVKERNWNPRP